MHVSTGFLRFATFSRYEVQNLFRLAKNASVDAEFVRQHAGRRSDVLGDGHRSKELLR